MSKNTSEACRKLVTWLGREKCSSKCMNTSYEQTKKKKGFLAAKSTRQNHEHESAKHTNYIKN